MGACSLVGLCFYEMFLPIRQVWLYDILLSVKLIKLFILFFLENYNTSPKQGKCWFVLKSTIIYFHINEKREKNKQIKYSY